MYNKILLTSIILLSLMAFTSCNSDLTSTSKYSPTPDYESVAELLEQAYQGQSQIMLDNFFSTWKEMIPPYSSRTIATFSDTIQQIYAVFQTFHSPTDLNRLTGGQQENFETDFRYIVVQNHLRYAVVDTNPQYYYYNGVTSREYTITDFRPILNEEVFPVVYLSSGMDSVLYRYLYQPDGTQEQDHQQRVNFLRDAMQLTHHHWISDYHKATMPIVSNIYINKTLTQALVTFRVFYQFGDAYLERQNNNWILVYSRLTGIE